MSENENLIIGIRKQRETLDQLIDYFEQRERLFSDDFGHCDVLLRKIEKDLKGLRKEAIQEMLRANRLALHLKN